MLQRLKKAPLCLGVCALCLWMFASCKGNKPVEALEKRELFHLNYGTFENELKLFDVQKPQAVNTRLLMRDGFFYIANGESAKIMQLTSYGDLLSILYNADTNPVPSFVGLNGSEAQSALEKQSGIATQSAVIYPFNEIGALAVDSEKRLYAADILPYERYVRDKKTKTVLRSVVLRFRADGSFIDYLGQEGPGGTPFPYIKNLYTNADDELIAVCLSQNGYLVFWFTRDGRLKFKVPLSVSLLPEYTSDSDNVFAVIDQVIPDYHAPVLYLKTDYFPAEIDASTHVQSGIIFDKTLIHPFDVSANRYEKPVTVPDLEQRLTHGYTKEVFSISYEFLGVSESGWFFFITVDSDGFSILMLRENGQKIIRRHLAADIQSIIYHDFSLSPSGIISALFASEDKAAVLWWRTDTLIDAIIQ